MGELTNSGLLYEGIFDEWTKKLDYVLDLHYGYTTKVLKYNLDNVTTPLGATPYRVAKSLETLATVIRTYVHPRLLARVPKKDRSNGQSLFWKLRSRAQPFRFTSLPADVRYMVYELVHKEDRKISPRAWGPIVMVSPDMRAEALPFYIRTNVFECDATLSEMGAEENNVVHYARGLAEGLLRGQAKHLRYFHLELNSEVLNGEDEWEWENDQTELRFTFSNNKGLEVTCFGLDSASEALVQEHVANVEASRTALGLQGEAIILALISKPGLWVEGTLHQSGYGSESDDTDA